MARNFYIDNINDNDKLNEISILLNQKKMQKKLKKLFLIILIMKM